MVFRQVTCHFPRCLTCTLHLAMALCLVSTTRGLHKAEAQGTVEIYPQEPTLKVGQTLTLTCEINHPNIISAVDIQWSHDGEPLSSELYSALDTKRSRLVIPRAGFQDSGVYACNTEKSAQQGSNSTEVNVGDPPSAAKDLNCFSRDNFDITCEWTPGSDTNIPTFDYLFYVSSNPSNVEWETCRSVLPGNTSCVLEDVHETYHFYVLSVNRLGNASTAHISFDHETETVSNPPKNVRVKATPQSRLHIEWDFPEEWRSYYVNHLMYKIEYFIKDLSPTVSSEFPGPESDKELRDSQAELPFPLYLDAYTIYCVKVAARMTGCPWSSWSETVCKRTLEQNPDLKLNVTFSSSVSERNESLRHVVLEWEPLPVEHRRGIIIGYNVMNVTIIQRDVISNVTLNASQTSLVINDLERFQKYKFAIEAFNSAGASPRTFIDIPQEYPQYLSSVNVTVVAVIGVLVILTLVGVSWHCIKWMLKPVPSIYFIAPEQFERILDGRVPRRDIEREVFDLPPNHCTPNGVIPNGILGNTHLSQPCAEGGCAADHGEADYVKLREEASKESDRLLCEVDSCRKLSRTSTDSANSSEDFHEKDPLSPGSTTGGSGKLSALFVHLPGSVSLERLHTGLGRSALDSTDSGYGETCTENRVPSYLKLSTIQTDGGLVEVPPSAEFDTENDEDGGGDVYHRLGTGEAIGIDSDPSLSQSQPCIYSEETMPSYTRLVAIPGPLSNGVAPSLDNGHLLNGTAPSFDNHGPGST
ncbi:interleukin-6 receptor subunit beta-like [Asterias amurensis]|uniref:interleukin-6 receptor subunit beta-like n=1 Tax=Asterias amurensis TaxID=7602 RepID=UPI003AB2122B